MAKLKQSDKTIEVRAPGGDGTYTVQAFETEDGELVAPSAYRQSIHGPKVHGGHCGMCNAELEPMTNESRRGICDDCVKADKTGRWSL